MGHTSPDPLIYVFLSLASHNADVFSSAPPIKTFFLSCFFAVADHFDKSAHIRRSL